MKDMEEKRFQYGEHVEIFPNLSDTASANECTGLMPTPPVTPDEYESYQELHSMEVPKAAGPPGIPDRHFDDKPEEISLR